LHAFTISPHPNIGIPDASQYDNLGFVRAPKVFDFTLTPRSETIAKLILGEAAEAEMELKDWE
jgi:hypothetical protein